MPLAPVKSAAVGVVAAAAVKLKVKVTQLVQGPPCPFTALYSVVRVEPTGKRPTTVVGPFLPHGPEVEALPEPVPPPERGVGVIIQP